MSAPAYHRPSQLRLLWRLLTTVRNWPVYFLNRFGWMEGRKFVRFRLWNGFTIVGRPFSVDRAIINEEWLDRCYEPNDVGIPWDWNACRTIVDVGAHTGTFTLYAAAHAPNARILAFEPEASNAAMLRRNIAENRLEQRVETVEAAISDHDGTATFHVTFEQSGSGGHSLYKYAKTDTEVTVPLVSLASIFARPGFATIDFLKLDCEGAEYDALYGLSDNQLSSIRFIAMEYHHFSDDPRHAPEPLKTFLEQHGFAVMKPSKGLFFAVKR
jgi:FkbM family methyltransferase